MEVKPGYKQTDVGVIPEDWNVFVIESLVDEISMGPFGSDITVSNFVSSGIPVLNGSNVAQERLHDSFENFVTPKKAQSLKKAVARRGDVVVTHRGTIGQVAYIPEDSIFDKYVISQSQFRARFSRKVLPSWVVSYFHSEIGSKKLLEGKGHTGVPAIAQPTTTFRSLLLPIPPLPEQREIATALSDMDALLDGLDHLIAKKRAIKQATMQQLLTGQTRLPGFSGEWEVKRLGDHLNFLKNGVNSRAELSYSEDIRYLHYGDIHGSSQVMLNPVSVEMPCLPRAKASRLDRLQDGDLIYADASEDMVGIGKSVEIQNATGIELVSGLHTIAIRFNKSVLADGFKAYIQLIPEFRAHLRQLAAGTKVYATNRAHIASAELSLPGIDEQQAISALLTDMDTEITALETRRTKTRALKQAMMQELLTGRTRLV